MGVAQEGGEPVARQQWKTLHMLDKCAKDHVQICDGLNRVNTIGGVLQKKVRIECCAGAWASSKWANSTSWAAVGAPMQASAPRNEDTNLFRKWQSFSTHCPGQKI